MEVGHVPLLMVLLPSLIFSVLLAFMAGRRGLSRPAWFFIGLIPGLNLLGLVVLALKPAADSPGN
jgi:hypothetical protein